MQVWHWTCLAVLTILAKKSSSRKLVFHLCLSYLTGLRKRELRVLIQNTGIWKWK